jgi:hypothetical protein
MTVHPLCQPIANTLGTLQSQRDSARAALPSIASPAQRWTTLAEIGDLTRQIEQKQRELDDCQRTHAAVYEAELVAFDTANAPPPSRVARLWKLEEAGAPTILESSPVQAGQLTFPTPTDTGLLGITIEETGNPAVQGLDFRSGPITELPRKAPDDPSGRVEIVLGPQFTFTTGDLERWLQAAPLPLHTSTSIGSDAAAALGGNVDITVANLGLAPQHDPPPGVRHRNRDGPALGSSARAIRA